MMKFRSLHILLFALIVIPLCSRAQSGSVTFYSVKLSAKEGVKDMVVPVGKNVPFTGWLFDGKTKMAHAQGGRFFTFHISPGEHQFTVPYRSKKAGKEPLMLNVENGGHYCIRLSAKYISGSILVPIAFFDSQIESVPCQLALQEAGSYKPLDLKRINPPMRQQFDPSSTFPAE